MYERMKKQLRILNYYISFFFRAIKFNFGRYEKKEEFFQIVSNEIKIYSQFERKNVHFLSSFFFI